MESRTAATSRSTSPLSQIVAPTVNRAVATWRALRDNKGLSSAAKTKVDASITAGQESYNRDLRHQLGSGISAFEIGPAECLLVTDGNTALFSVALWRYTITKTNTVQHNLWGVPDELDAAVRLAIDSLPQFQSAGWNADHTAAQDFKRDLDLVTG